VSVQVLICWFGFIIGDCLPVLYRRASEIYSDHNSTFMTESSASSAPRAFVSHDPAVVHVGIVTVVLGICDALAAVLPASSGDSYMLTAIAVLLSPTRGVRVISMLSFMYVVATLPLPHAYGMLRMFSLLFAIMCANVYFPRKYAAVRVLVSVVTAISYVPTAACTSPMRAVPPVALLYLSLYYGSASPTATLIIAAIFA